MLIVIIMFPFSIYKLGSIGNEIGVNSYNMAIGKDLENMQLI